MGKGRAFRVADFFTAHAKHKPLLCGLFLPKAGKQVKLLDPEAKSQPGPVETYLTFPQCSNPQQLIFMGL